MLTQHHHHMENIEIEYKFRITSIIASSCYSQKIKKKKTQTEEDEEDTEDLANVITKSMVPVTEARHKIASLSCIDDKNHKVSVKMPMYLFPDNDEWLNGLIGAFEFVGILRKVDHDTWYIDRVRKIPTPLPLTTDVWKRLCPECTVILSFDRVVEADDLFVYVGKKALIDIINMYVLVKFYLMYREIRLIYDMYPHSENMIADMSYAQITELYDRLVREPTKLCFYQLKNTDFPELTYRSFNAMTRIIDCASNNDSSIQSVKEHEKVTVLIYQWLKIDAIEVYSDYVRKQKDQSYDMIKAYRTRQSGHMFSLKTDIIDTCKTLGINTQSIVDALDFLESNKIVVIEELHGAYANRQGMYLKHVLDQCYGISIFLHSLVRKRENMVSTVSSAISIRDSNSNIDNSDMTLSIGTDEDSISFLNDVGDELDKNRDSVSECLFTFDHQTYYGIYERIFADMEQQSDRDTITKRHLAMYAWQRERSEHSAIDKYDLTKVCPISCRTNCRLTVDEALLCSIAMNDADLNAEQRMALLNIAHNSLYALSGRGGTGKTHVLQKVVQTYGRNKVLDMRLPYADVIGTALSAHIVSTLRSKIGLYARTLMSYIQRQVGKKNQELHEARVVIIEENTMIPCDLLCEMFKIVYNGGNHCVQKIIVCGDIAQLPPIGGTGDPFRDFVAVFPITYLRRNMRNISVVNAANANKVIAHNTNLEYDDTFVIERCIPNQETKTVVDIIKKYGLVRTNDKGVQEGWNDLKIMAATRRLAYQLLNPALFQLFCSGHPKRSRFERHEDGTYVFKWYSRMKVYFLKNSRNHDIQNGKCGMDIQFLDARPTDGILKSDWMEEWTDRQYIPNGWTRVSDGKEDSILHAEDNVPEEPVVRFMAMVLSESAWQLLPISGKRAYKMKRSVFLKDGLYEYVRGGTVMEGFASTIARGQGTEAPECILVEEINSYSTNKHIYTGITRSLKRTIIVDGGGLNKSIMRRYVERRSDMWYIIAETCDLPTEDKLEQLSNAIEKAGGIDKYIAERQRYMSMQLTTGARNQQKRAVYRQRQLLDMVDIMKMNIEGKRDDEQENQTQAKAELGGFISHLNFIFAQTVAEKTCSSMIQSIVASSTTHSKKTVAPSKFKQYSSGYAATSPEILQLFNCMSNISK